MTKNLKRRKKNNIKLVFFLENIYPKFEEKYIF